MLMKGKSYGSRPARPAVDAETVALRAFDRLAADDERMGRFLAPTGLQPGTIRDASASPGFLPAILDHVCGDERLLVAIAGEIGAEPDEIAAARARLSPVAEEDW